MSHLSRSRRQILITGAIGLATTVSGCTGIISDTPKSTSTETVDTDWSHVYGDVSNSGRNPEHTLASSNPSIRWTINSFNLGQPTDYAFLPTPAIGNERLFIGGETLSAHGTSNGDLIWNHSNVSSVNDVDLFDGIALTQDKIIAEFRDSSNQSGLSLFTRDGTHHWRQILSGQKGRQPITDGSRIYLPTEFQLIAADIASGDKLWELTSDWHFGLHPAIGTRSLYLARGLDGVVSFPSNQDFGKEPIEDIPEKKWELDIDGYAEPSVAIDEDRVYIPQTGYWDPGPEVAELTTVSRSGEVNWWRGVGTISASPVLGKSTVFQKSGQYVETVEHNGEEIKKFDSYVYAFEKSNGNTKWERKFPRLGDWRIPPVLGSDTLYVPLYDRVENENLLTALDLKTGRTRWTKSFDAPIYHLALGKDLLVVSTIDGNVHGLR